MLLFSVAMECVCCEEEYSSNGNGTLGVVYVWSGERRMVKTVLPYGFGVIEKECDEY